MARKLISASSSLCLYSTKLVLPDEWETTERGEKSVPRRCLRKRGKCRARQGLRPGGKMRPVKEIKTHAKGQRERSVGWQVTKDLRRIYKAAENFLCGSVFKTVECQF